MFSFFWKKSTNYETHENYTKILMIQSTYRMYVNKKKYKKTLNGIRKLQLKYRKRLEEKKLRLEEEKLRLEEEKKNEIKVVVEQLLKEIMIDVQNKYERNREILLIKPKEDNYNKKNFIVRNKLRNKKVYHQYLDNTPILDVAQYRRDYNSYLNSNYDFDYLKKYKMYDDSIDCTNTLRNSLKTISSNINLLKNCLVFDIEKNSDNLKRQKLGSKYIPRYGTYDDM